MVDAGISPGDLVVIKKQDTAAPGDIVVALDDENRDTLKKFAGFDPAAKKAILRYENESEYPGKEILVNKLVVLGIAKHVIKAL